MKQTENGSSPVVKERSSEHQSSGSPSNHDLPSNSVFVSVGDHQVSPMTRSNKTFQLPIEQKDEIVQFHEAEQSAREQLQRRTDDHRLGSMNNEKNNVSFTINDELIRLREMQIQQETYLRSLETENLSHSPTQKPSSHQKHEQGNKSVELGWNDPEWVQKQMEDLRMQIGQSLTSDSYNKHSHQGNDIQYKPAAYQERDNQIQIVQNSNTNEGIVRNDNNQNKQSGNNQRLPEFVMGYSESMAEKTSQENASLYPQHWQELAAAVQVTSTENAEIELPNPSKLTSYDEMPIKGVHKKFHELIEEKISEEMNGEGQGKPPLGSSEDNASDGWAVKKPFLRKNQGRTASNAHIYGPSSESISMIQQRAQPIEESVGPIGRSPISRRNLDRSSRELPKAREGQSYLMKGQGAVIVKSSQNRKVQALQSGQEGWRAKQQKGEKHVPSQEPQKRLKTLNDQNLLDSKENQHHPDTWDAHKSPIEKDDCNLVEFESQIPRLNSKIGNIEPIAVLQANKDYDIQAVLQEERRQMKEKFNEWKQAEQRKMDQERRVSSRQDVLLLKTELKRLKEETESQRKTIQQLKSELQVKDNNHKILADRMKRKYEEQQIVCQEQALEINSLREQLSGSYQSGQQVYHSDIGQNGQIGRSQSKANNPQNKQNVQLSSEKEPLPKTGNGISSILKNLQYKGLRTVEDPLSQSDHDDSDFEREQMGDNRSSGPFISSLNPSKGISSNGEFDSRGQSGQSKGESWPERALVKPKAVSRPLIGLKGETLSRSINVSDTAIDIIDIFDEEIITLEMFQSGYLTEEHFIYDRNRFYQAYLKYQPSALTREGTVAGRVCRQYADGKRDLIFPQAAVKEMFVNGYAVVTYSNKDVK